MRLQIRPFQPADLPRLREIAVEAFEGVSIDQAIECAFGTINTRDWKWRKARHVDDDLLADAQGVFVATPTDSPEILGFVTSRRDSQAGIGFIPNVCVAAGWRGRGVGRQLLAHVLEHFRRCGLTHARIETLVHNEVGYGLYTSLGFQEVTRQVHFAMDLTQLRTEDAP